MARLAALRKAQPKLADKGDPNQTYIIAVQGLLPAHPTEASPSLETSSSSDASHSAGAMTEQILESFMAKSSLGVRSGTFVRPQNVQIEAETGVVRLFFPRTLELGNDKEALFTTRYGSLTVKKRFRMAEMLYKGRLKL
jgi:hypothetical protein